MIDGPFKNGSMITGTVVFDRSGHTDCKCCEGHHIYCRHIQVEERPSDAYSDATIKDIRDWMRDQIADNSMDGEEVALIFIRLGKKKSQ